MKHLLSMILLAVVVFQTVNLATLVHLVVAIPSKPNSLQEVAMKAGLPNPGEKIMKAVALASEQTGLSEPFLLALIWSESSFKTCAISSKQYQGLMQIPKSSQVFQPLHREEDINTLIGSKIFVEKLKITHGDYRKALVLYKGWPIDHPEGKRQADKVLVLARKLKAN